MSVTSILIRRELNSWILSPVFYSYCFLFSFFSLAAMFLLSAFIEANEASLSYSLFRWLPWIFAMTTPVIGIRSWSEEHNGGVFEVLGTQPIKTSQLVLAKALSAFVVIAFSLLCTAPALITVTWLGDPDLGVIASGYIGSFLCGCAFVAVSQAVCAFMRGSIGAFVCSVAICLTLLTAGITRIANIILATFPDLSWVTELLSAISITPKFEPFIEGRIELSAVLGFSVVIIISLMICRRALLIQRASEKSSLFSKQVLRYGLPISSCLIIYILSAFLISLLPGRFDLTEGQRFGLPESVATELNNIERDVTVRFFASASHPDFGFDLVRYQHRIKEMLNLLSEASHNKVTFELLDPNANPRAARIAAIDEVRSIAANKNEPLQFAVVIESLNQKRVFDAIDPKRERYFLADLVQAVLDVSRVKRKKIGVLSPFSAQRHDNLAAQNWTGINILKKAYDINYLEPLGNWGELDIVILLHPTTSNNHLAKKLEKQLKQGTDLVVMVDTFSLMSANFAEQDATALQHSSLPDFIKKRGITLSDHQQVYDLLLATENQTEDGVSLNPAILTLTSEQFNANHAITSGFDFVHFVNVGALSLSAVANYQTETLISSSKQALLLDINLVSENNVAKIEQAIGQLTPLKQGFPLMVLQTNIADEHAGRLIVGSDTDWLFAMVAGMENENGRVDAVNSNLGLIQNIIDFLAGNRSLRELRMRSLAKRSLETWDVMREALAEPFRAPLAASAQRIQQIESELNTLYQARNLSNMQSNQSAQIERQVSTLNQSLRVQNAELSSLRSQREAAIQARLNIIKWLNVLTLPLSIALFGLFINYLRVKKVRGSNIHE